MFFANSSLKMHQYKCSSIAIVRRPTITPQRK